MINFEVAQSHVHEERSTALLKVVDIYTLMSMPGLLSLSTLKS